MWIKIDREIIDEENDIYFAFAYIPEYNSNYYNIYNLDRLHLFECLEQDAVYFKSLGNVFLLGDLNARTSNKVDFNDLDSIHSSIMNIFDNVMNYEPDEIMNLRNSEDKGINTFGRNLLNFCKSSGYRLINGRSLSDKEGKITHISERGNSVIDYAMASVSTFRELNFDFNVGNFAEFSDHAPLYLHIKCKPERSVNSECTCNSISNMSSKRNDIFWNNEAKETILDELVSQQLELDNILTFSDFSSDHINQAVNKFTEKVNSIFKQFCWKEITYENRTFCRVHRVRQP